MDAVSFLLEQGSAVIRYRTLVEICNSKDFAAIDKTFSELVGLKALQTRLANVENDSKLHDFNGIHGATNYHLENSLPMLLDFGLKAGFPALDQLMLPVIERLQKRIFPEGHVFSLFPDIIINPFLYRAGYASDARVLLIKNRINTLYEVVKNGDYALYDELTVYKGIPKNFARRKVIQPSLYNNGNFAFPLIYDLYGFSLMYEDLNPEEQLKVERIIRYILDDHYQSIEKGYGILVNDFGNYLVMGWDCKLPEVGSELTSEIICFLDWLSFSPTAKASQWYKEALNLLLNYKTEHNTFLFPKEALVERNGVWILGNHMSIGENRRQNNAYELESTFWAIKILKANGRLL